MTSLSFVKFATPEGADQALGILNDLQKQNVIQVEETKLKEVFSA